MKPACCPICSAASLPPGPMPPDEHAAMVYSAALSDAMSFGLEAVCDALCGTHRKYLDEARSVAEMLDAELKAATS